MVRAAARLVAMGCVLLTIALGCTSSYQSGSESESPTRVVMRLGPPPDVPPNPLGGKWIWSELGSSARYVRGLAGGATWHEVVWCEVEPKPGHVEWDEVDRIVDLSRRLGYQLDLKIRVGSCWATPGGSSHVRGVQRKTSSRMPREIDAYTQFVKKVVNRYAPKGVSKFAIENEPNAPSFWNGSVSELASLSRIGARAIRSADPKAKVVSPSMAGPVYGLGVVSQELERGEARQAVETYRRYFARRPTSSFPKVSSVEDLKREMRTESVVRALRFLRMEERLLADGVYDIRQVHHYEPYGAVPALLRYLDATTSRDIPVEAWEVGQFGAESTSPEAHAIEETKTVASLLAGGVRRVMWLPVAAKSADIPEKRYGLIDPDGGSRPAGRAFHELARLTRGRAAEPLHVAGLEGAAFTDPHSSTTNLVVWSTSGRVVVPRPEKFRATSRDFTGNRLPWPKATRGLEIGPNPVLLRVDASLPQVRRMLSQR